ncbi:MAG: RNA polymerase factor sigma-54 [Bacteroidetes bacterium]|nr:RNA polymerase factor sigma-54 [Bacteroidota bacterium]MBS1775246.1 RNA polymerase factor sigma-54 [Bacteroidota bacterium]
MIRQSQQQRLLQKLSPQQIQLMKLLQIPTVNLEERIKEEIEENPALEYADETETDKDEFNLDQTDNDQDESSTDEEVELTDDTADKVELDDFLRAEDEGDYGYDSDYYQGDQEEKSTPVRVETSFHEYLLGQLSLLELNEQQERVAEQIIGSIDDDGYLRREPNALIDDLAFGQNVHTTIEEVQSLINQIRQHFDPPGVCAWSLQECLILQLNRLPQTKEVKDCIAIIDQYFNEFTKKHYEKIQRHLGLNDDDFRKVIHQIIKLNPKPGSAFAVQNKAETYVIPDFFVFNNNGKLELSLNSKNAPELRVSEGYREMMKAYDRGDKKDKKQKEAVLFIKQKLDAAKWFIDAIKQRQHTLLQTMQAIIDFQTEFFLSGDDTSLRPMILKDIANITYLDVSTVSRVANSKFVQTEFGTYKLKYFFSESLQTESGEEVSTREVKSILTDIISKENKRKPFSDDKLTDMLLEKGYNIARRTVAKYREQLNIPVARLRKEL